MKDSHKAIWLKRKNLGRAKYLLYFGLLPWGVGLTVLTSLFEFLSFGSLNPINEQHTACRARFWIRHLF